MKVNQLKIGVMLSYINQGFHFIISILYTPIMLSLLGQSEYGLYQMVNSVVAYLSLLNMGFTSGYVRFYSRFKVSGDEKAIESLNGMFFTIFSVISAICVVCGVVMIANARNIFGDGLTSQEISKSKVLMGLLIFNMAISFLGNVFSCNISSQERFFFIRVLELLRTLLNPFLTLPVLLMGYGSVGLVVVSTVLTVVSILLNVWYSISKLNFRFSFGRFDFSLFKEMWSFTFFIFINMIVDQINWNVDKFIIGRYLNTSQVSVYSIGAQLNTIYITFSSIISSVFVPRVNRLVEGENSHSMLTDIFTRVGRIQFIVVGFIMSGFIFFGRVFIKLWVGDEYSVSYIIGLILMLPTTIPLIQNLGIEIQRAKNMHRFRSYLCLVMAFANIFVSIWLIKMVGVLGAPIGTAISLFLCNFIIINIFYHKKIGLDMLYFWRNIFKFIPSVALYSICGYTLNKYFLHETWASLIVCIAFYCIVYVSLMYFLGMNKNEKAMISNPLKKMRMKLCKK